MLFFVHSISEFKHLIQDGIFFDEEFTPEKLYELSKMDGAIILLQVDGEIYQYHTGGDMQVFLCENPAGGFQITPKPDEFVPPPDSEID